MVNLGIRAVTTGIPINELGDHLLKEKFSNYTAFFMDQFDNAGFSIRTQRICLSPINHFAGWDPDTCHSIIDTAQDLAETAKIRWICVPFDFTIPSVTPIHSNIPLHILKKYPNCFVNVMIAQDDKISISGAKAASVLVKNTSKLSLNGFDNFRLGIASNCKPNIPFFPYSYNGDQIGFSFAVETLLTAIEVAKQLDGFNDLDQFRNNFKSIVKKDLEKISKIGLSIENETGFEFKGVDISFAPFPGESSIVDLFELLGLEQFGGRGTVFLTSILTDLLREVLIETNIRATGFNGVMFSLLEDAGLAKRNNQKMFDIDSMQLFSTVCGCGLDMVPIPGSILEDELTGILLDSAALSVNLKKPLGIRVLPIPQKDMNELTDFNYDFLVNTRVKEVKNAGINTHGISNELTYKHLRDL